MEGRKRRGETRGEVDRTNEMKERERARGGGHEGLLLFILFIHSFMRLVHACMRSGQLIVNTLFIYLFIFLSFFHVRDATSS